MAKLKRRLGGRMRTIVIILACLLLAAGLFGARVFLVGWYVQPSSSMEPTLRENESMLVNKTAYGWPSDWVGSGPSTGQPRHSFHAPQRGDICSCR